MADTRDLKSLDPNRSCRFKSGPWHQFANRTQLDALDSQQSLIERPVQKILYKLHKYFCSNEGSRLHKT